MNRRMVSLLLGMSLTLGITGAASVKAESDCVSGFQDVPSNHAACQSVKILREQNIVSGYGDGTFRPNNTVSRAEIAKMIILTQGWKPLPSSPPFEDVSGHWVATLGFVQTAKARRVVKGYPDDTFHPDASVTRAEAIKMAVAAAGLQATGSPTYQDVPSTEWYAEWVVTASAYGLIGPAPRFKVWTDSTLQPNLPATRGEVAMILANLAMGATPVQSADPNAVPVSIHATSSVVLTLTARQQQEARESLANQVQTLLQNGWTGSVDSGFRRVYPSVRKKIEVGGQTYFTDKNGDVTIMLPPGQYSISYQEGDKTASIPVSVTPGMGRVELDSTFDFKAFLGSMSPISTTEAAGVEGTTRIGQIIPLTPGMGAITGTHPQAMANPTNRIRTSRVTALTASLVTSSIITSGIIQSGRA